MMKVPKLLCQKEYVEQIGDRTVMGAVVGCKHMWPEGVDECIHCGTPIKNDELHIGDVVTLASQYGFEGEGQITAITWEGHHRNAEWWYKVSQNPNGNYRKGDLTVIR